MTVGVEADPDFVQHARHEPRRVSFMKARRCGFRGRQETGPRQQARLFAEPGQDRGRRSQRSEASPRFMAPATRSRLSLRPSGLLSPLENDAQLLDIEVALQVMEHFVFDQAGPVNPDKFLAPGGVRLEQDVEMRA